MKRRLLLFLGAICAVVVLWTIFGGQKHRFTLADGTTVTFHGVSVGLSNRYCFGNAAQHIAAKLPWQWAQRYAASTLLTVTPDLDTNLVVWVTYRGAAPRAGRFRFRCVHDGGTNELTLSGITKYGLPSGEAATGFCTAFWPRRSKRFTLQYLDADAPTGKAPLWEIRVSNPLYANYPQWQPEVLPGSRTVGDVSFILDRLVPSDSPVPLQARYPTDVVIVQARFRVTSGGLPNNDWEICGGRFRDSLGNPFQQQTRILSTRDPGGRHEIDLVLPLLAGERAGKLGVAFVRTRKLPTNDLFTLPEMGGLPAPGRHLSQTVRTNTPLGLISLTVIAHNLNSGPEFDVAVLGGVPPGRAPTEPGARWFLPLAARDDRGRDYSFAATGGRPNLFDSSTFRRIYVPRDAQSLVFTVAASPVVFVEYTVGRENITRGK